MRTFSHEESCRGQVDAAVAVSKQRRFVGKSQLEFSCIQSTQDY
jgi:hypothetical protein